jgi:hypothetical protein
MPNDTLAPAIGTYVEAYHAGDRDALTGAFADDASVSFGRPPASQGKAAIRAAHERIGTFHFTIDRVFDVSPDVQIVEGRMFALHNGAEVTDVPVDFVAIAELIDDRRRFQSLRFYYDGGRVRQAVEAVAKLG